MAVLSSKADQYASWQRLQVCVHGNFASSRVSLMNGLITEPTTRVQPTKEKGSEDEGGDLEAVTKPPTSCKVNGSLLARSR